MAICWAATDSASVFSGMRQSVGDPPLLRGATSTSENDRNKGESRPESWV